MTTAVETPRPWRAASFASLAMLSAFLLVTFTFGTSFFDAGSAWESPTIQRRLHGQSAEGAGQSSPFARSFAGPAPVSVRDLHPQDIRIVAAIGDSITAGFAAKSVSPMEYRGLTFSIGGDDGRITLPSIMQNQTGVSMVGAAKGFTDPLEDAADIFGSKPLRPVDTAKAHFNAAISNAKAESGPTQVQWLAQAMAERASSSRSGGGGGNVGSSFASISLENDWKLLTVLLGANDLRAVCRDPEVDRQHVADLFAARVNSTLNEVRRRFSRVFVALLAVPDVGAIAKFRDSTWICKFVQDHLEGGHCPDGEPTSSVKEAMNDRLVDLQRYWNNVVAADDFAVVYQPFTGNVNVPNASYLSSLDCFHPGAAGHAELAVALWNSLITPSAKKATSLHVGDTVIPAQAWTRLRVD